LENGNKNKRSVIIMKIAISSSGKTLNDTVDSRFGRAQHFIIYDTDTKTHQIVENAQNANTSSGAGIQAASLVVNQGANAVITGNCGPKAFAVLKQAGVPVYLTQGCTIAEAIQAQQSGKLTPTSDANVEGHW
jgi:predicted Fe-Mo cluster-binding NifX family protein